MKTGLTYSEQLFISGFLLIVILDTDWVNVSDLFWVGIICDI